MVLVIFFVNHFQVFHEDVAGAWVWDVVDRGGVECSAWQAYCRDTLHPCVNIGFQQQGDSDWFAVDLVVPDSIGFDVVRKFKSGKVKSQTKEQVCFPKIQKSTTSFLKRQKNPGLGRYPKLFALSEICR